MDDKENNEELRPTKMRGVVFPKAKYGVIAAIIIIVVVNLIYYKDFFLKLVSLRSLRQIEYLKIFLFSFV